MEHHVQIGPESWEKPKEISFGFSKEENIIYSNDKYRGQFSDLNEAIKVIDKVIDKFNDLPDEYFIPYEEGEFNISVKYDPHWYRVINFRFDYKGFSIQEIIKSLENKKAEIIVFFNSKGKIFDSAITEILYLIGNTSKLISEIHNFSHYHGQADLEMSGCDSYYIDELEINNSLINMLELKDHYKFENYRIETNNYKGDMNYTAIFSGIDYKCKAIVLNIQNNAFFNSVKDILLNDKLNNRFKMESSSMFIDNISQNRLLTLSKYNGDKNLNYFIFLNENDALKPLS